MITPNILNYINTNNCHKMDQIKILFNFILDLTDL